MGDFLCGVLSGWGYVRVVFFLLGLCPGGFFPVGLMIGFSVGLMKYHVLYDFKLKAPMMHLHPAYTTQLLL